MNIDCHAHYIPPAVLQAARVSKGIEVEECGTDSVRFRFPGLSWSARTSRTIVDKASFLEWQTKQNLDLQVLSCWTDLLGYTLDAAGADAWCNAVNEALAAEVEGVGSLEALGVVPLAEPSMCPRHLDRILELGLRGVIVGTSTPEMTLDDPLLDPFWASVEERRLAVLVHPIFLGSCGALEGPGMANAVGRTNVTNIAISRLLLGGVLNRYPELRLIVSHGGAGLPLLLGRLDRNYRLEDCYSYSVREGFSRLYFDTVVCDPLALRMVTQVARPEQLVLGSDFPFPWEPQPLKTVIEADLGDDVNRMVCETTPQSLFGLPNSQGGGPVLGSPEGV